jgi:hypothetical protein
MSEQLTVEVEPDLKKALLHYCETTSESIDSVVSRALLDFMAKATDTKEQRWFGLPSEDYFSLSEEERETLWTRASKEELDKLQLSEREIRSDAVTARQRNRAALHRRLLEIRQKSASHS